MNLPRAEDVLVLRNKIENYLLHLGHPIGGDKARFFFRFGFRRRVHRVPVLRQVHDVLASATLHSSQLFGDREAPASNTERMTRIYGRAKLVSAAACRRLSTDDALSCEDDVLTGELDVALRATKAGRAPGPDGLSVEQYEALWPELGAELCAVFNDALVRGELPEEMQRGAISLLYKRKGDARELGNWRPLTMLNVDHKLLSRCIATRLSCVVPRVVHSDQRGFVRGRQMVDAFRTVQDTIDVAERDAATSAMMVFIDQSQALIACSTITWTTCSTPKGLARSCDAGCTCCTAMRRRACSFTVTAATRSRCDARRGRAT